VGARGKIDVYIERGTKRTFAGAVEWPGWSRSGPNEEAALESLLAFGPRWKRAVGRAASGLAVPSDVAPFEVVERLKGDGTTDFGAPSKTATADERPIDEKEAKRLAAILRASWKAFDRTAQAAEGVELRKGPRGGGRDLHAIVEHVMGADRAYLSPLGAILPKVDDLPVDEAMAIVRKAFLEAFLIRAGGGDPPRVSKGKVWAPRYAVRRSAWHALDHVGEIEERSQPN